ncbi:MAG: YfcE family phosphodiesterase [Archaeoglobaceae archaeon]
MKIIALADTHLREWGIPKKLEKLLSVADFVVHAGDFTSYEVYRRFADFNLIAVRGNSDDERVKSELDEVAKFEVGRFRFGVVHSGNYVNDFHDLIYRAMELEVDVLIFGHLHRFVIEKRKGIVAICPGSPTQPRMSVASCAEIEVEREKISFKHHVVHPIFCSMEVKSFEDRCWG